MMPVFPRIIKPYEDELLYSYLRRLALEYSEPSYYQFLNEWFRGTMNKLRDNNQLNRYDTAFDISSILTDLLNIDSKSQYLSIIDAYLSLSVYSFYAPLWAEYQKADWVLNQFRPMRDSALVPHIHHDLVGKLRYCPECMKEEGERFYHLSHNLPGVTACWKHKVRLNVYSGKAGSEMTGVLSEETEPCSEWEARYARFAKDLAEAKISGNLNATAKAVRDRMNELEEAGKLNSGDPETVKAYMDAFTGMDTDIENAYAAIKLRKESGEFQKRSAPEKTLSVIAGLFKDIEEFKSYIDHSSPQRAFNEMIQKRGYEMVSAYHPYLVILQHSNCLPFVTSPELIIDGWGCPDCEDRLTPQELFRNIFRIQKGGEYELLTDFEEYLKPVRVRHNECGKEYSQMPVKLIKRNVPCSCHLDVNNIERASKWLADHYPQFEIMSFTDMTKEVTLVCNDCLSASTYPDFYYFMDHPRCRCCNAYKYDRDRLEGVIRDLVGNEYTLVSDFESMHDESTVFRHNICGTEFKCAPVRFIRGIRCSKCHTKMTVDELNDYLKASTGNIYEIIRTGENTPDLCTVRNNKTGETQELHKTMILQELNRPTPSIILEVDEEAVGFENKTAVNARKELSERLETFLKSHPAFLKSDFKEYCKDIAGDDFDGIFSSFVLTHRIKLINKAAGIYEDFNSDLSCMEILENTLVKDYQGNHRGYFSGKSFLSSLRNEECNDLIIIVSNEFAGRKKITLNVKNRRISASGPQYDLITNENWKSMCLLTWTIGTTFSKDESVMKLIRDFASDMRVTEEMMERYSSALDKRVFGRYRKLVKEIESNAQ